MDAGLFSPVLMDKIGLLQKEKIWDFKKIPHLHVLETAFCNLAC
jgi:hypothetical protein